MCTVMWKCKKEKEKEKDRIKEDRVILGEN